MAVQWPEYEMANRQYLVEKPDLEVVKEDQDRIYFCHFWNHVFYPAARPLSAMQTGM